MERVTLGYKALDLHELTCHYVACHAGLYAERDLDVTLLDTRRLADAEVPPGTLSVACGSALLRWLDGEPVAVVLAAAARPMFWLYGRAEDNGPEDLAGLLIATWPAQAPPAHFLRAALVEAGVEQGQVRLLAAPDDAARLAMLESGKAQAALVSSAVPPWRVEERGFRQLLCLGDRLEVPTTGLAVDKETLESRPQRVAAMEDAFAAALELIHHDDAVLSESLRAAAIVDARDVDRARSLVREFYTETGRVDVDRVLPGVQAVARLVGRPLPSGIDGLYACAMR